LSRRALAALLIAGLLAGPTAFAQSADPKLSPHAPKDKASPIAEMARFDHAIAPYVAKARASYPQARKRYLAGLPAGQSFFVTTRLHDQSGGMEQVFIAVKSIKGDTISGKIWNDVRSVRGFRNGDMYTFGEAQVLDWLITKPDGSEEGNFVGKFLDTYDGR
jgi:hypothetical protein